MSKKQGAKTSHAGDAPTLSVTVTTLSDMVETVMLLMDEARLIGIIPKQIQLLAPRSLAVAPVARALHRYIETNEPHY